MKPLYSQMMPLYTRLLPTRARPTAETASPMLWRCAACSILPKVSGALLRLSLSDRGTKTRGTAGVCAARPESWGVPLEAQPCLLLGDEPGWILEVSRAAWHGGGCGDIFGRVVRRMAGGLPRYSSESSLASCARVYPLHTCASKWDVRAVIICIHKFASIL